MLLGLAGALALIGIFVCLRNWRTGVLVSIIAGFLADPVRKLTPGQPVAVVLAPLLFMGVTLFSALIRGEPLRIWRVSLLRAARVPLVFGACWLIFAASMTIARYGSLTMAGIGLLSYAAPLPALLLAYRFGWHAVQFRKALLVYLGVSTIMQVGGYLAFFGVEWDLLEQVGEGLVISSQGLTLEAYSGFFRSPETAGWHAATAICLLIILVTSGWLRMRNTSSVALIFFLLGAGIITGRRKMLAEIVMFLAVYSYLLLRTGKGAGRLTTITVLTAFIAALVVAASGPSGRQIDPYLQRGVTVFGEAPDRLSALGLSTLVGAIYNTGFFGGGLGVASQGSQHFGGGSGLVGYSAEGGLGKVTTELGVPGLVVIACLMVIVARFFVRLIGRMRNAPAAETRFAYGIVALLVANAAIYMVAAQVFGDPFVLLMLGLCTGFLLARNDRLLPATTVPRKTPSRGELRGGRRPLAAAPSAGPSRQPLPY